MNLPKPYPLPSKNFYDDVIKKASRRSLKTFYNYLKFKLSKKNKLNLNYVPIRADIENVSRCNFACTMCIVSTWHKRQRSNDLDFNNFKEFIDRNYGLVELKIQGYGEPFLQKDTLIRMIEYARQKNIWVRLITNASLLHLNDNYKKVIDADVNEIQISIDGATEETFESIREGSKFRIVKNNCKLINDYAEKKGKIITKLWTTVQKKNIHELEKLIKLAKEINFKHLVFSLELNDYQNTDLKNYVKENITNTNDLSNSRIQELLNLSEEENLNLYFWKGFSLYSKQNLCPWPFERVFVSSDFKAMPCCYIADPKTKTMADLNLEKDPLSFWNNREYTDFRKKHISGDYPDICKNCYNAKK